MSGEKSNWMKQHETLEFQVCWYFEQGCSLAQFILLEWLSYRTRQNKFRKVQSKNALRKSVRSVDFHVDEIRYKIVYIKRKYWNKFQKIIKEARYLLSNFICWWNSRSSSVVFWVKFEVTVRVGFRSIFRFVLCN